MGLFDFLKRKEKCQTPSRGPKALLPGRPLNDPKKLAKHDGSVLNILGRGTPRTRDPIEVLRYIVDFHPESSLAVWNFLRMVASPFTMTVKDENGEEDVESAALLRERMSPEGTYGRDYGGGVDNLMRVLVLTLLTQGAVVGELELSDDLDDVTDWNPVSPYTIRFFKDKETGHFRPAVLSGGTYYLLPEEQVRYFPLDPSIGDPHGRGPFWSAFEIVYTHAEVLRDLKAVAHFAGWPRLDVTLLQEIIEAHMPDYLDDPGEEAARKEWLDGYLSDVQSLYNELEVDDAFIHYDWLEAKGMDAGRPTFDVVALVAVIERSLTSALKHLPQLLGRIEGSTQTHSTVQWQIFAQSIEALRNSVKTVVEWWANMTLRILGIPSKMTMEFKPLRTQDREREAKARHQEWRTELEMFFAGLQSQRDLAVKFTTGQPVADVDYGALLKIPLLVSPGAGGEEGQAARASFIPGAPRTNEALLQAQLPAWMKYHQRKWQQAVGAFADSRRWDVFDALLSEPGGNGGEPSY